MKVHTEKTTLHTKEVRLKPLIKELFPKVGDSLSFHPILWRLARKIYGDDYDGRSRAFSNEDLTEISRVLIDLCQKGNKGFRLALEIDYGYEDGYSTTLQRIQ